MWILLKHGGNRWVSMVCLGKVQVLDDLGPHGTPPNGNQTVEDLTAVLASPDPPCDLQIHS